MTKLAISFGEFSEGCWVPAGWAAGWLLVAAAGWPAGWLAERLADQLAVAGQQGLRLSFCFGWLATWASQFGKLSRKHWIENHMAASD